jgi:methionyl-tRNA formyltransferase
MRVVLISQVAPAVEGYARFLHALGHEPVALLCTRADVARYGELVATVASTPPELDVVMPSRRSQIAPLLRMYEPDLALCAGFPWKIPADAIGVPRHGIVNGHPSLLPRYRGASPVSWAIRNGETEIGFTFHYMDAELDTGNLLAQAPFPLGVAHSWEQLTPSIASVVGDLLPAMLERVEAGDPGDPQDERHASYYSFFEPEYAWIDWSRPRVDVERQVRAWGFHSATGSERGALAELDGERVRILRTSLDPVDGVPTKECGDGTIWIVETEAA